MANATWKEAERRVGRALGAQRVGPTGRDGPDVLTQWLAVEVKHRAQLPAWLGQALAKIRAQAGPARLGIVVAHAKGARDSWVILSLKDFCDWFGGDPAGGLETGPDAGEG